MKRVLVVDDSLFIRMNLKKMLEENGYEVVGEAENGEVAIEKYNILKPDIITMDITMPVLDGLAALKRLKGKNPDAKVIMISAVGQEANVIEAIQSGARGFIVKPFKAEHILNTLSSLD